MSPLMGANCEIPLIERNAKCRHLKNRPVKGFCGRCLSVWGPCPPPHTHTVHILVYSILIHKGKGGRCRELNQRESWRVNSKAGSKLPAIQTVSPVYTILQISTCRKVFLQVNLFRWRHFAFGVCKQQLISPCSWDKIVTSSPENT